MTSPLKDELDDKQRKGTDGKTSQQPNIDNRHGSDGEHNGQHDITRPAIADKDKLLQPSLERTSTNGGNGSAFKSKEKLPGDFPHVIVPNAGRPATDSSRLAGPKIKPPVSTEHEQVELDYGEQVSKQVQSMSLNQARTTLNTVRSDLRARGYNPQERVLGYGTEPSNPNNPFVHPDALYNPNPQTIDLLQLRQARQQSQGRQLSLNDPSSLESLVNREEALRTDPFGIRRLQGVSDSQLRQQEREAAIGFTLANATPEQRRQYEQRQAIKERHLQDPDLRQPASLQVRLRLPEEQLTPEQQRVYGQQQELQATLRTGDMIAHHIDQLQAEYTRNDWQEDSHWYGLDDKKFLQDVQSRNLYHVSDYDKFRVLGTIERIKTQTPDIFATKELSKLTPQQRQLREMIDGKINESTGKREPGLQDNVRTQLVQRLRHEVTKLDIALVNQQSRQGLVSNAADSVIGHIGKPGGWGGMFMDSDATSQATRDNLERARQASQNLLALSEFKGNNLEFAKAYQVRVRELGQSIQQTSENLGKMADAHQGRIEGVSDIAQVTAALSATLACASAAPETFGGSLAAIPIVAPMAAGAAGKVVTKLLESETSATGSTYTMPDILQDTAIAAITSAPFLPGNRIAKPLLQAESTVAKQVAATEGKQLVMQVTTASIEQTAKTTGTELTVKAASQPLIQQVRQTGANLAKHLTELTPKTAAELTVKYAAQAGKRTAGYALAGGIDGATIQGTRAVIKGQDPLQASAQGFVGGAILGPVMGPAIKYGGALAKKGMDWLRTSAVRETAAQAARDIAARANTTYTIAQVRPGVNIENTVEFAQPSSNTRPGLNTNSNYMRQEPVIVGAGHEPLSAQPAILIEPEPTVGAQHPADNLRVIPPPSRQFLHMTPDPENPESHFLSGSPEELRTGPASPKPTQPHEVVAGPPAISKASEIGLEDILRVNPDNLVLDSPIFAKFDKIYQAAKAAEEKVDLISYRLEHINIGDPEHTLFQTLKARAEYASRTAVGLVDLAKSGLANDKLHKAIAALTPYERAHIAEIYQNRCLLEQKKIAENWIKSGADPDRSFLSPLNNARVKCYELFQEQKKLHELLVPPKVRTDFTLKEELTGARLMVGQIDIHIDDLERYIQSKEVELETGNIVGNYFRRRDIAALKQQLERSKQNLIGWKEKISGMYSHVFADMQPGEKVIIGKEGDVPVFNHYLANEHARLERLEDGTYALTDCIPGESSRPGELDYGTFVKRVGQDGKDYWELVSSSKPTILNPGDRIRLGFRADRPDLDSPGHWEFTIPKTKAETTIPTSASNPEANPSQGKPLQAEQSNPGERPTVPPRQSEREVIKSDGSDTDAVIPVPPGHIRYYIGIQPKDVDLFKDKPMTSREMRQAESVRSQITSSRNRTPELREKYHEAADRASMQTNQFEFTPNLDDAQTGIGPNGKVFYLDVPIETLRQLADDAPGSIPVGMGWDEIPIGMTWDESRVAIELPHNQLNPQLVNYHSQPIRIDRATDRQIYQSLSNLEPASLEQHVDISSHSYLDTMIREYSGAPNLNVIELGPGYSTYIADRLDKSTNFITVDHSRGVLLTHKRFTPIEQPVATNTLRVQGSTFKLPVKNSSQDILFAVHHDPLVSGLASLDPAYVRVAIDEVHRVLKPDGKFIVAPWDFKAHPITNNTYLLSKFKVLEEKANYPGSNSMLLVLQKKLDSSGNSNFVIPGTKPVHVARPSTAGSVLPPGDSILRRNIKDMTPDLPDRPTTLSSSEKVSRPNDKPELVSPELPPIPDGHKRLFTGIGPLNNPEIPRLPLTEPERLMYNDLLSRVDAGEELAPEMLSTLNRLNMQRFISANDTVHFFEDINRAQVLIGANGKIFYIDIPDQAASSLPKHRDIILMPGETARRATEYKGMNLDPDLIYQRDYPRTRVAGEDERIAEMYSKLTPEEARRNDILSCHPYLRHVLKGRYGERQELYVLELGAAERNTVPQSLNDTAHYTAVDLYAEYLKTQNKFRPSTPGGATTRNSVMGDTYRLPIASNSHDVLVALKHPPFSSTPTDKKIAAFNEAFRILKPDGELVIDPFIPELQPPAVISYLRDRFDIIESIPQRQGSSRLLLVLKKK